VPWLYACSVKNKNKNFVNFELFFVKLSGIDPYEKRIDYLGGHA
jgi:hypothetical protein